MPNYDLSSADLARVANQEVDLLRIEGQTIWEKPQQGELYTVWDGAAIALTSHSDVTPGAYIAQQFARYAGAAIDIEDVGVYVPDASPLIGQPAIVSVQLSSTPLDDPGVINTMAANESDSQVLSLGWNWIPFSSPIPWSEGTPYILAGYRIGVYYLYNDVVPGTAIVSPGGFHELVPWHSGGFHRSWYSGTPGGNFVHTNAGSYGIDVRIRATV